MRLQRTCWEHPKGPKSARRVIFKGLADLTPIFKVMAMTQSVLNFSENLVDPIRYTGDFEGAIRNVKKGKTTKTTT